MTTYATATEAVYDYFLDNFTGVTTANMVLGNNMDYTPVNGTSYIKVNVVPAVENQVSIGSSKDFRDAGIIVVDVFTPKGVGDSTAKVLIQEAHNITRNTTIGGDLRVRGSISHTEFGIEGNFYHLQTTIEYHRDIVYT